MKALGTAAVVAVALAAGPSADSADVDYPEYFAPMAFLAGSCWRGPFPDGKKIDSHCFKWFQRGRYLRERNELIGSDPPYGGETTYYWDHASKRIAYIYWGSDGGVSTGWVTVEDGILKFPDERYAGPDGALTLRSEIKRTGPDEHHRQSWIVGPNGEATPMLNAKYVREPLNW